MTDTNDLARIAEGLRLAEQIVSDPHHPRCSVHDANACDCYRGSRRMYVIAEALVTQQAELERTWAATKEITETGPDYGCEHCLCGAYATPAHDCPVHWAVWVMKRHGFDYTTALVRERAARGQPYPTAWAYERACAALWKNKRERDAAQAETERLRGALSRLDVACDEDGRCRLCWHERGEDHAPQCPRAALTGGGEINRG